MNPGDQLRIRHESDDEIVTRVEVQQCGAQRRAVRPTIGAVQYRREVVHRWRQNRPTGLRSAGSNEQVHVGDSTRAIVDVDRGWNQFAAQNRSMTLKILSGKSSQTADTT